MDSRQSSPGSSVLQTWLSSQGIEPLSFPKFPTFQELVDQFHVEQAAQRPRSQGMFQALLGDVHVLYVAWLDNPNLFDQQVGPLLLSLMTGRRLEDLTPAELELLNVATLEFAQYRPPEPKPKPVVPVASKKLVDLDEQPYDDESDLAWNDRYGEAPTASAGARVPLELADGDVAKVPTRWWLRS